MNDFREIISNILEWGWTQEKLAAEVGCSQATISYLANTPGADPRDSVAAPIKEIYQRRIDSVRRQERRERKRAVA